MDNYYLRTNFSFMIFNNPAVDISHVCFSPVLAIFVKI